MNFRKIATTAINSIKKNSPDILIYTGVVGVVAGTVMACVATTKLNKVLDDHSEEVKIVHSKYENDTDDNSSEKKKELTKVYVKTGWELVKLYGPAFAVEALSISGILSSNAIMKRRNTYLMAAYATLDSSFKEYRKRVSDRFGEEVESELRNKTHKEKVEEVIVDENGKKKKVKKEIDVLDDNAMPSDYARYFVCGEAKGAIDNLEFNKMYLKAQQSIANEQLGRNGYVLLNDVYDLLGIERSKAGYIVGWVLDYSADNSDNYIDFRAKEVYRKKTDGSGEMEKVIILDFNVDGPILDRLVELKRIDK